MKPHSILTLSLCLGMLLSASIATAEPWLQEGDRIAILGDSRTSPGLYSKKIEAYLLACAGRTDLQVFSGSSFYDTAQRLAERKERFYEWYKPTAVLTFLGGYARDNALDAECKGMEELLTYLHANNVRVMIGSPACVDRDLYGKATEKNASLADLSKRLQSLASEKGAAFADVFSLTLNTVSKMKDALGTPEKPWHFNWRDGYRIYGGGNGLYAYGFLKELGLDGHIATITLDYATGKADVSEGVTQTAARVGGGDFTSTRYPCRISGFTQFLDFVDFQNELNRFTLKVTNLPSAKASVQFGNEQKEYSKAELEAGINLADYIHNPFEKPFEAVMKAIEKKQQHEEYVYDAHLNFAWKHTDRTHPKTQQAYALLDEAAWDEWKSLHAAVLQSIQPIAFSLEVKPLE